MAKETDFPLIPGNSTSNAERPLNKGIQLHLPPQGLPEGAFLDSQNLYAEPSGLRRRGSYSQYTTAALDYPPVSDIALVWATDGEQYAVGLDQ